MPRTPRDRPSPHRSAIIPSTRGLRVAVAAAAVGVLLSIATGCTTGSSASSAASSAGPAMAQTTAAAFAADNGSASAAAGSASVAGSSASAASSGAAAPAAGGGQQVAGARVPDVGAGIEAADRQVIRTANLTLDIAVKSSNTTADADQKAEQDAVDHAVVRVRSLATDPGYVSAAEGKGTTQSITLRVPVNGYSAVMDQLAGIAPVISREEATEDVTAKMIDISSRMETMTASVNRVRALLSKADKIGDVISIESELSSREADLESLQRQQAALAGQTSLSTITVVLQGSITGVKPVVAAVPLPPVSRSGFLGGLANGWDAVRKVGHAGLTVVGTLIPFVPVLAVLVFGGLYLRRRIRGGQPPVRITPAVDPRPAD